MFENFLGMFSKQKSGAVAKDRMQLLLAVDRQKTSVISDETINKIKEEIMQVIGKYIEVDTSELDIKVERKSDDDGRVMSTVVANIPINKTKK